MPLDHCGDVAQLYGLSLVRRDDGIRHLVYRTEFVQRSYQETLGSLLESPAGEVDVFGAQAVGNDLDAEIQLCQTLLIDLYLDFLFEAATHFDRRRAFHGF